MVSRKLTPKRIAKALQRRSFRRAKLLRQRLWIDQNLPKIPVFILGCQRSGTTMLLEVLDQSFEVFSYGETDRPAMCNYRLAKQDVIESLIRRSPARVLVFKPICDSQWADQLLDTYERSKVIWIYRHFNDMINSSLQMFSGQFDVAERMAKGELDGLDWRVERLNEDDLAIVKKCFRDGLTRADASALGWLRRTNLYNRLELHRDRRVHLVKYEELVSDPVGCATRIFRFIGISFRQEFVTSIHGSSLRKNDPPKLSHRVRELCEALQERMDEIHRVQETVVS